MRRLPAPDPAPARVRGGAGAQRGGARDPLPRGPGRAIRGRPRLRGAARAGPLHRRHRHTGRRGRGPPAVAAPTPPGRVRAEGWATPDGSAWRRHASGSAGVGRPDGLVASTDADSVTDPDWVAAQLDLAARGACAIGGRIDILAEDAAALPAAALAARTESMRRRLERAREREPFGAEHGHFSGASMALTVRRLPAGGRPRAATSARGRGPGAGAGAPRRADRAQRRRPRSHLGSHCRPGAPRPRARPGRNYPRPMTILDDDVKRYLEGIRPRRSEVMAEMEARGRARRSADRGLGGRAPACHPRPRARSPGPGGGHRHRLLHAPHRRSAARGKGRDTRTRSRARGAGPGLPRARRRIRPRGDRGGGCPRHHSRARGPVRPALRGRLQGRVRALHRAGRAEALGRRPAGDRQPAHVRRGGRAEGAETRWDPASLASARALNLELTTGSKWFGSVLPVGDGVGLATRA